MIYSPIQRAHQTKKNALPETCIKTSHVTKVRSELKFKETAVLDKSKQLSQCCAMLPRLTIRQSSLAFTVRQSSVSTGSGREIQNYQFDHSHPPELGTYYTSSNVRGFLRVKYRIK